MISAAAISQNKSATSLVCTSIDYVLWSFMAVKDANESVFYFLFHFLQVVRSDPTESNATTKTF